VVERAAVRRLSKIFTGGKEKTEKGRKQEHPVLGRKTGGRPGRATKREYKPSSRFTPAKGGARR
jgi:hypothetical protein